MSKVTLISLAQGTHRLFASKTEILIAGKILQIAFTAYRLADPQEIIMFK